MKKYFLFSIILLLLNLSNVWAVGGTSDNITWTLDDDGLLTISGTNYINYGVASFTPWYSYRDRIRKIEISEGITGIGNNSFNDIISPFSIDIPNSVTGIGMWAFLGSTGLTSVSLPNDLEYISQAAFLKTGLISIQIPSGVTTIENLAFSECESLVAINVSSDNLTYSSLDGVLYDKEKSTLLMYPSGKVAEFAIPEGVTKIGSSAFNHSQLTSIGIPNGITEIGSNAFSYSKDLVSVKIPASVETIGSWAFYECQNLQQIWVEWQDPIYIPYDVFSGVSQSSCTLYVPKGTLSFYQEADIWNNFNIEEVENESSVALVKSFSPEVTIYPNVVTESFQIKGLTETTLLTLYNTVGKIVLSQTISPNEVIYIGNLDSNIYQVRIGKETRKLIKK
jgi:hypothetical protein